MRAELKLQREVQSVCSGDGASSAPLPILAPPLPSPPASQAAVVQQAAVIAATAKAHALAQAALAAKALAAAPAPAPTATSARKNRWGPSLAAEADPLPKAAAPSGTPGAPLKSGHKALPEHMDEAARRQLRDQKQMQVLQEQARQAARITSQQPRDAGGLGEAARLHSERLKEYHELAAKADEDGPRDTIEDAEATGGVIEGGTWEHRKRAKEMLATADQALGLTVAAAGKRHVANFLPKDQLNNFLSATVELGQCESFVPGLLCVCSPTA